MITDKLRLYNEMILQQSNIKKFTRAPSQDVKSIMNWHYNYDYAAIAADEQLYLNEENDLICVFQKDNTPLRRVIDSSLRLRTLSIWKRKTEDMTGYDARYVSYYSDKRIDRFASSVIVGLGAVMLIAPIWILQAMKSLTMKLVVITMFVFFFLLILSFAMVAKPFEALGATAAYAAVLMVFIQFGA
ncbi:hypothetical protein VHEMI02579 [[Torrubiella] hemipterigena]|uniref:DUF6594 domain-containing protein n=1 Tax=[Torrubiella] hemipterigena TaxID=1531966 RepID=A0A0A1TAW8_9HYPO|nr:hypothetical protein VHEMI02579 [[Torrubiella] hemipterigena]